ncbi:MAG: pitrilysin family protein [Mycoplasmatota bacterium]
MEEINLTQYELKLYFAKLENGLELYVIPKNDINNVTATLVSKYGSNKIEFIPNNKKEYIKVPTGVAHFLEHKMFEQEDGLDPFEFFTNNGVDCNASTNYDVTSYYFSGTNKYEENLNYLLDYVQSPYFVKESIEKEKGIITQELKMYLDDPAWALNDGLFKNTFNVFPQKNPIGGSIEDVNSTTVEDLYNCYNTFYHPSNLFLVVVGNVDKDTVFNLVKENQDKKTFETQKEIVTKEYNEEEHVALVYEEKKMEVVIPKFSKNYKIKINKETDKEKLRKYTNYMLKTKFGETSLFLEKLKEKKYINTNIDFSVDDISDYLIINFEGETPKYNEVLKEIENELKDLTISIGDLERRKKMSRASIVYLGDQVIALGSKLIGKVTFNIDYKRDEVKYINDLNINEYKDYMKLINFVNHSTFIILPK